jgi:signal transduction histidine kinase
MNDNIKSLMSCDLFKNIEESVIVEILAKADKKEHPEGTVLIEKGTIPKALFIVASGKVGIYNEDILLAELGSVSVLGESFLASATATATIIAKSTINTLEIERDVFFELAKVHPALVFNIFVINFTRLRSSNDSALKEARSREEKLEKLVVERTHELNQTLQELRATNNELSITRDNLIQTQKFRDQFLANMSHEIRTPMNAIVGLTNLLLKSPLTEIQDKYLNVIKKSGANLLVIINDILDLAKIEAGKMELENEPFPLITSINNVHTILGLKAEEKGIYMREQIQEGVPAYVFGDETRITQVLMNLAGNAIKFTEKGGVTISVSIVKENNDEFELRFGVRDTGIGIPPDKIEKIFESFGQATTATARKFGGTGLGLTISRQLVEMHNGELKVDSVADEGSEFYFIIKYKKADKLGEEVGSEFGEGIDLSSKKILLVEDNEFNQMVAVDTLSDLFPGI